MRIDNLSKHHGVPAIALANFPIAEDVIRLVPKSTALEHQLVPVNFVGSTLIVAMRDPFDTVAIEDVRAMTGRDVEVVVAAVDDVREAIIKYYGAD